MFLYYAPVNVSVIGYHLKTHLLEAKILYTLAKKNQQIMVYKILSLRLISVGVGGIKR